MVANIHQWTKACEEEKNMYHLFLIRFENLEYNNIKIMNFKRSNSNASIVKLNIITNVFVTRV